MLLQPQNPDLPNKHPHKKKIHMYEFSNHFFMEFGGSKQTASYYEPTINGYKQTTNLCFPYYPRIPQLWMKSR